MSPPYSTFFELSRRVCFMILTRESRATICAITPLVKLPVSIFVSLRIHESCHSRYSCPRGASTGPHDSQSHKSLDDIRTRGGYTGCAAGLRHESQVVEARRDVGTRTLYDGRLGGTNEPASGRGGDMLAVELHIRVSFVSACVERDGVILEWRLWARRDEHLRHLSSRRRALYSFTRYENAFER